VIGVCPGRGVKRTTLVESIWVAFPERFLSVCVCSGPAEQVGFIRHSQR